ncbi:MAG: DUF134 domain-containing protein [Bacillota bacterium]|jgi:predicted DNA-binding protein (UPF0251 family)
MSRPVKPRRISFIPEHKCFVPVEKPKYQLETVELKIEELEAMRLKDLDNLFQEDCAEKMQVSRQTFQLIIDQARKKVTKALIEGKTIIIQGGNYTLNICKYKCSACGQEFNEVYEKGKSVCPRCQASRVNCIDKDNFCLKGCRRRENT